MKKILLISLIFLCVANVATAQVLDTLRVGGITGGVPPFTFQWYRVPAATTSVTAADTIAANRALGDSQRDWYVVPTDEPGSWRFFAVVRSPYCGTYVLSNLSGVCTVNPPIEHPNFAAGCLNTWGDGTTSNWDIGQVFWGNNTDPNVGSTTVSGTVGGVARTQIWSALVRTEFCSNRTTMINVNNRIDCRNNAGHPTDAGLFDYFSWCFVMKYADLLCPYPWRVPTRYDFEALDTIFAEAFGTPASPDGGSSNPAYFGGHADANRPFRLDAMDAWTGGWNNTLPISGFYRGTDLNQWAGGRWTEWAYDASILEHGRSFFWSSTPTSSGTTSAYTLNFAPSFAFPRYTWLRRAGLALRCVR